MRRAAAGRRPQILLLAILLLYLAACGGGESYTYDPPPQGIPDTPYWYRLGDSVLWYTPIDSVASVQMVKGISREAKSEVLFALRDMGWRMTVERTYLMRRPGEPQDLSQYLFAVERLEGAVLPVTGYHRFRKAFWQTKEPVLLGLLPGLHPFGEDGPKYFWPSNLALVWQTGVSARECENLMDSLGCEILTSPKLIRQYWIDRSWAVALPPGAELFSWLRMLNDDPRVRLAHPIETRREPPVPDQRIIRRLAPLLAEEPASGMEKLSDHLKTAYEVAIFAGNTSHVRQAARVTTDPYRFHIIITVVSNDPETYPALVDAYDGELINAHTFRIEAWLPYVRLVDLAADERVKAIIEVRTDNLLGK